APRGGVRRAPAAMLVKPYNEFFKVAVSSAGNHDNNVYNNSWAERYHGLKEVPASQAKDEKKDETKKEGFKGGFNFKKKGGGAPPDEDDPGETGQDKKDKTKDEKK